MFHKFDLEEKGFKKTSVYICLPLYKSEENLAKQLSDCQHEATETKDRLQKRITVRLNNYSTNDTTKLKKILLNFNKKIRNLYCKLKVRKCIDNCSQFHQYNFISLTSYVTTNTKQRHLHTGIKLKT